MSAYLSARESQVLRLVARGYTDREIAAELLIAPGTARFHVDNAARKLGATSRPNLVACAYEVGELRIGNGVDRA